MWMETPFFFNFPIVVIEKLYNILNLFFIKVMV